MAGFVRERDTTSKKEEAVFAFNANSGLATQAFFIANRPYVIVSASEIHSVVGGASAAVDVFVDTGTAAPGAGATCLSSAFDCTATANTLQTRTIPAASNVLNTGDRLSVKFSGTLTGLTGVVVVISLVPAG